MAFLDSTAIPCDTSHCAIPELPVVQALWSAALETAGILDISNLLRQGLSSEAWHVTSRLRGNVSGAPHPADWQTVNLCALPSVEVQMFEGEINLPVVIA